MRRELEPREVAVDRVRLHYVPELRERGAYLDARQLECSPAPQELLLALAIRDQVYEPPMPYS